MKNDLRDRRIPIPVVSPVRRKRARLTWAAIGASILLAVVVAAGVRWGLRVGGEALPRRSLEPESAIHPPDRVTKTYTSDGPLPVVPGAPPRSLGAIASKVDPSRDPGWHSESFGEAATVQLKNLGKLVGQYSTYTAEQLADTADQDVASGPLRPELKEVFRDDTLAVYRSVPSRGLSVLPGREGLAKALQWLREPFESKTKIRVDFKTVRVQMSKDSATTVSHFHSSAPSSRRTVQQNAIWTCRWTLDEPPRLLAIEVSDFEEVVPVAQSFRGFTDFTEQVIGGSPAFKQQLRHGTPYWLKNLDIAFGIPFGNQGLAIADVNGDGLDDVYVNQPAGLPNRLFLRQPDGTVVDASDESGLNWLDDSAATVFVDLDNDGDQDAAIVLTDTLLIHENKGQGKFLRRQEFRTTSHLRSLSSADYDNDGDLDLFVCGYNLVASRAREDVFTIPVPYHDANNGGPNLLVRNDGQFRFTDVTEKAGLDVNNRRFSYAAAWEDFDNDGDADVYVANDYGRNNLYRNDDGSFVDVASEAGVEDIGAGMSVSWGDYDRDGLMDLYVGNMFSSAGNRISHQPGFKHGSDESTLDQYRRHARGNSLFRNRGDGRFRDVSVEAGVTMGRWAWGSMFVDINNDGWEDLCVENGFITSDDTGDL